ncbi:DUF1593 domain-containing protein [uncultured Draconibacterium sp.]|uniref:DUF1593 domain-containing protein n=1 Tax=uncultured Draconibacterium sp. TaxID=1573823 RepID=UPI003216341F
MKNFKMNVISKILTLCTFLLLFSGLNLAYSQEEKPRVIVMTDGEIDDQSSMIRFLLYTNDVDVEGIIYTNSIFQRQGWEALKWIEKQIDAYDQVYRNLIVHDPTYPTADELRSKIYIGDDDRTHLVSNRGGMTRVPGMEPQIDPANWSDTQGSDKIVEALLKNDPRPVYILAWGGGNTAARAFYKLQHNYPEEYKKAASKAIMYNILYQDGAGNYIEKYHPEVTMLLCLHFSETWNYGAQRYTKDFVDKYLHEGHGPLAKLYPQRYISEGDSPSFFYILPNGLRSRENPTYGGWGGQFYKVDGFENVYRDIDKGTYQRWIEYINRDFEARLQWCVAEKYEDANHRPVIKIIGSLDRIVKSGETVVIEAEVTDPDSINPSDEWDIYAEVMSQGGVTEETWPKNSMLRSNHYGLWWQYKEAGNYNKMIDLPQTHSDKLTFIAPEVDEPSTIHMVLEVHDRNAPRLFSFARVIITVMPAD